MHRPLALEDLLHPWLARYMQAPAWVKSLAGRVYGCLPPRVRLGSASRHFERQIADHVTAAAAEALALEKLEETLRWALDTVPAYSKHRRVLARSGDPREVLSRLPLTDKLDIKRAPDQYLSVAMPERSRLVAHTGGSTRTPMRFFLQKHVTRAKEHAFIERFRARVGLGPRDVTLALRGRAVPEATRPGGRLWTYEPIKRQLILSSDHLERRHMGAHAEALARLRPAYIEAFPSALYPLARWLAENPLPEFTAGVKGVMLYSENVQAFQIAKFREVFGCPIVAHYGHSERVLMAATMPDDWQRYYFWPQYGWMELVDARGRAVTEPGKVGFVVGTSFDNRVMPFVRYRTGDLAVASDRRHPLLPGFPAVERIAGRIQEFLVCRDLRLVSITAMGVGHFPELAAIDEMQYEQSRPGEVVLKVAAARALSAAHLRAIGAALAAKTQGGCDVQALQVDRIPRTPRGKARLVIQHLDVGQFLAAAPEIEKCLVPATS